jgi:starch-binding outer membrane protein, SusD/RagB family
MHPLDFLRLRRRAAALLAAAAIPLAAACSPDDILDVEDPDIINPANVRSAAGADAVRLGVIDHFNEATSGGESMFLLGGLMADEWSSGDTFQQRNETDQRNVINTNANVNTAYRQLHRARVLAEQTIPLLEEFDPDAVWKVGQMLNVQGLAEVMLAEHFCSGVPFSSYADGAPIFGVPLTDEEANERALDHFQQALDLTTGTEDEDELVRNVARTGAGRALINLGRYAEAATMVAGVTDFAWHMYHSQTTNLNNLWVLNGEVGRWTMADNEAGVGIDFVSANDPRLPTCVGEDCLEFTTIDEVFDTNADIPLRVQLRWPSRTDSVAISSYIEARLIAAEAALQAGNYATPVTGTLAILNELRADFEDGTLAPLAPAADAAGQEDQLFRERAFWLYSTGHRLGDMRRLIRPVAAGGYGRAENTVFPSGAYFKGGTYGTDVNFPVTQAEENNPNFTGCIDRDP